MLDHRERVERWGAGVVKVALTDLQRVVFAAVVHDTARELIDGMLCRDPSGLTDEAVRLQAVLSTPRTRLALWESLAKGVRINGRRLTAVHIYRRSARYWAELLIASRGHPPVLRSIVATIACRLMLSVQGKKRGPKIKTDAAEAARLVDAARRRGKSAVKAAAARLSCDEETIRRALRRRAEADRQGTALALIERLAKLS